MMGRLIKPLPRIGLTAGDGAGQQTDSAAERILKYIPAEVVTFYLAALGIIDTVADQNRAKNYAYLAVLLIGVVAAPLYIRFVGRHQAAGRSLMIIWSIPSFLIWAYSLGGIFKVWGIHEPWIGSLLLLFITLVAGLLPIPHE